MPGDNFTVPSTEVSPAYYVESASFCTRATQFSTLYAALLIYIPRFLSPIFRAMESYLRSYLLTTTLISRYPPKPFSRDHGRVDPRVPLRYILRTSGPVFRMRGSTTHRRQFRWEGACKSEIPRGLWWALVVLGQASSGVLSHSVRYQLVADGQHHQFVVPLI